MDINAQEVKNLRIAKGWTQQHLADACAISLRTVQRVEKFGTASPETLMGLCAVFEITQEDLIQAPPPKPSDMTPVSYYQQPIMMGLTLALGSFIGAFVMYLVMSLN